jgi:polyisoprenoid-binding protein YceI
MIKFRNTLLFASMAAIVISCGGNHEEHEEEVVVVPPSHYELDKSASTLNWKGSESPDDFHIGTVDFSAGSLEMVGDSLVHGEFTVDLLTMKVTDEGMPEEKKGKLVSHLQADDFFNTAVSSKVEVHVHKYEAGKLTAEFTMMGKSFEQTVDVTLTNDDKGATLSGKFNLDLSSLMIPGFQPQEGYDEFIQPIIEFDMNIQMTKK